jgi:hypothetical protein
VTLRQPAGSAGITPACTNELLPRPRRPDDDEERRATQPVDEGLDLALTPEEALGIGAGERGQPGVGRHRVGGLAPGVGKPGVAQPVPEPIVAALEGAGQRRQPGAGAVPPVEEEELLGCAGAGRRHLRQRPQLEVRPSVGVEEDRLALDQASIGSRATRRERRIPIHSSSPSSRGTASG